MALLGTSAANSLNAPICKKLPFDADTSAGNGTGTRLPSAGVRLSSRELRRTAGAAGEARALSPLTKSPGRRD